jgi:hypothetical protein
MEMAAERFCVEVHAPCTMQKGPNLTRAQRPKAQACITSHDVSKPAPAGAQPHTFFLACRSVEAAAAKNAAEARRWIRAWKERQAQARAGKQAATAEELAASAVKLAGSQQGQAAAAGNVAEARAWIQVGSPG